MTAQSSFWCAEMDVGLIVFGEERSQGLSSGSLVKIMM